MKIHYLGTAAAEGIPALFCQCAACKRAAQLGGKNIRTRSGVLINNNILIDFSPDMYLHKLRYGIDLSLIEHIFVTHSHTDHFDGAELTKRSTACYCHTDSKKPLHIYGNTKVCQAGAESVFFEFNRTKDPSLEFHKIEAYKPVVVSNSIFTPIPAVHDNQESCFIYLVSNNNSFFLYGNDTGLLTEQAYDFLSGIKLNAISLDCTFGALERESYSHMGFKQNKQCIHELEKRGCIQEYTHLFATHFSHNCQMIHDELEKAAKEYHMKAAYDGMIVEI